MYQTPQRKILNKTFQVLILKRNISKIKRNELYKKCFSILGVNEDSDQNTVRKAYIDLVKRVHPDSGKPEASADRFHEIDEAFKILQEKFAKNRRGIFENEEEKVFDIRHKAPQHRQYLSFEGIGVGTPTQRQKQYQQHKVTIAQERVYNHRVEKAQAGEKELMKKVSAGMQRDHRIKTKYGFDRVVEDLILEAMSKGDFDNLSCAGKPLSTAQSQNPYLDFTTAKLNKILIDNGFTPEWIQLQRDIRETIQKLNSDLAEERSYFGDFPFSENEDIKWNLILRKYIEDVEKINKLIDKYNLIVPIIENQFFRVNLERIAQKIASDNSLPKNQKRYVTDEEAKIEQNEYKKSDFFSFLGSLF
ncbi:dnaJ homolog subfamily C member 28 [Condylostylus longicornis]|uniref:dnaJ homolog subfamily C member 28 n=1 Tax=Condylostylus longicornis TaxID=2530218 RepID=UPI00244E173E|nr:dnaJ homolog subfamily C member 28 [Condylostylus longicornis]